MNGMWGTKDNRRSHAAALAFACLCAGALLTANAAAAQETKTHHAAATRSSSDDPDFFAEVGRWFDHQFAGFNANMKEAEVGFDRFGHDAGVAAKTGADAARDAADVLARMPKARFVKIHRRCAPAANGAPDCAAVAMSVCKTRGYKLGKSVDMTTAEKCPARVWASGHAAISRECTTETFVSRVLCN